MSLAAILHRNKSYAAGNSKRLSTPALRYLGLGQELGFVIEVDFQLKFRFFVLR